MNKMSLESIIHAVRMFAELTDGTPLHHFLHFPTFVLSFPFPFCSSGRPSDQRTAFCANPPFIRVVRIALTYLPPVSAGRTDRRKATAHVHPFCVLLLLVHTVNRTGWRKGGIQHTDRRADTDLITGTNVVGAGTFDAPPSSPISDEEHAKLQ